MNFIESGTVCAEMMVHVAICSHKEPKQVLVISDNKFIEQEFLKYENQSFKQCNIEDAISFCENEEAQYYDVAMVDSSDLNTLIMSAQLNRIVKEKGLIVVWSKALKADMERFSSLFEIVMPYRFCDTKNQMHTAIFISKKYHPTADIVLQRSDLLEGLSYYNTEIHGAVFVLPNYLRAELAGVLKQ
ncbi:MAG: spermidine synthase [Sulfurospirillaceae bacterium]|nr:spermidine synthase [Sulfurospirillaceae bacterium]